MGDVVEFPARPWDGVSGLSDRTLSDTPMDHMLDSLVSHKSTIIASWVFQCGGASIDITGEHLTRESMRELLGQAFMALGEEEGSSD